MPISSKIDGDFRLNSLVAVKIDDVWKPSNVYNKINGEWKLVHKHNISPNDIKGFKLVYKINKNKIWEDIPRLKYNSKLPIEFSITGVSNQMNTSPKGVLYQYRYELDNYEEGILCYEAILYAITNDELLINISSSESDSNQHNILNAMATNRLNFSVKLTGHLSYNSYGYNINGWNSLFDLSQFTDNMVYFDDINPEDNEIEKGNEQHYKEISNKIILPIRDRENSYSSLTSIGIARNTMTPGYNMLASRGILDHTIHKIELNNTTMPFIIEINE